MSRDRSTISRKLTEVADRPGVYLMRDRLGQVIYVGKARSLRRRLRSYFQPSRQQKVDPKTRSLLHQIADFDVYEVRSEPEALLLEGKLIKELRPRYNVSFRDDKRFLLVKVRIDEPWPRFELARLRKEDGARYFGPFAHAGSLRNALEFMVRHLGLRSCRPRVPTEEDYRHCMDDIIKHCSAPCIGRIARDDYRRRVEEACEFLEGRRSDLLKQLRCEMDAAAVRLEFERAAAIRDCLDDLQRTVGLHTRKFARASLPSAYEPVTAMRELESALGLSAPPRSIEAFDISNISGTLAVAALVAFSDGQPDRARYRRFRIRAAGEGPDDFRMIAEAVNRRYRRLLAEGAALPDLIVIDGGKGQLNAARKQLWGLGLETIPILGLAKKQEEIFLPERRDPVVLDRHSAGLRLLQQLRDEAHRFALTYHQGLRRRRIRDSLLDEVPGLGPRRRQLLLARFGSVERLRTVAVEELCAVRGIGPMLGRSLYDFLHQGPARGAGSGAAEPGARAEDE